MHFGPGIWSTIPALTEVFSLRWQKGQKNKRVRERRGKSNLIPPISSRNFSCYRVGGGRRSPFKPSRGEDGVALQTRHRFVGEPRGEREREGRASGRTLNHSWARPEHLPTMTNFFSFALYCVSRKCEGGLKEPRPLSSADENYQLGRLVGSSQKQQQQLIWHQVPDDAAWFLLKGRRMRRCEGLNVRKQAVAGALHSRSECPYGPAN